MNQATVSQIMCLLELDYDLVKKCTDNLENKKLLKKIEGKIERYVPMEPYFNFCIQNSKNFRDKASNFKDKALAMQSKCYDGLDRINKKDNDATQKIKDTIATHTLDFMNLIDDAFYDAEQSEEHLMEINDAAHAVRSIPHTHTWHIVGKAGLVTYLKDVIWRTMSSIIIMTPYVVPEILELISQVAYERKAQKFFYTTHWDLAQYGDIIRKMNMLGNIQFRQLKTAGEYWAVTRDALEIMLAPETAKDAELVCVVSDQPGYAKLYSQFIGPMFQANSQPLELGSGAQTSKKSKEKTPALKPAVKPAPKPAVTTTSRATQEKSTKEKDAQDSERLAKLQKLVRVSTSLKITQMAKILDMNEDALYDKILDWADQFGFTLDQDVVKFGTGRKDDFIDALNTTYFPGKVEEPGKGVDGKAMDIPIAPGTCPYCNKLIKDEKEFDKHLRQEIKKLKGKPRWNTCPRCGKMLEDADETFLHVKNCKKSTAGEFRTDFDSAFSSWGAKDFKKGR